MGCTLVYSICRQDCQHSPLRFITCGKSWHSAGGAGLLYDAKRAEMVFVNHSCELIGSISRVLHSWFVSKKQTFQFCCQLNKGNNQHAGNWLKVVVLLGQTFVNHWKSVELNYTTDLIRACPGWLTVLLQISVGDWVMILIRECQYSACMTHKLFGYSPFFTLLNLLHSWISHIDIHPSII